MEEYQKQGIQIVAISVDPPEESLELAKKKKIPFPLLSDPQMRVISAYGVAEAEAELAVPSVFLVSQKGVILWQHIGESISNRPTSKKLLEVIQSSSD